MKDSEIHLGWELSELRDAFSDWLLEIFNGEIKSQKKLETDLATLRGYGGLEIQYQRRLAEFEYAKTALALAKKEMSLNILIEEKGWQYFDVSDYVQKETVDGFSRSFIGTEEDYEYFVSKYKEQQ